MEERADPSKVVISNRGFTGGGFVDWVKEGRLKFTDRRAVGPKQKSDLWDAQFLSCVIAGMQPGSVVIDMRTEPYKVLDGNARIGAIVDFLNGETLHYPKSDRDLDGLSLWELGPFGFRGIQRRLSEACFSLTCIMPGTGDKEADLIAQFVQSNQ